jgi:CDP-diacylglycerol--serine O-phosphatidyltransferase
MKPLVTKSIIPNFFTLGNLVSGFTAIIQISRGEFVNAALFILAAMLFDALDGMMARLVRATSELGMQLDSLSDMVSFGIAPSYMLYEAFFFQFGFFGIIFSSLPAIFGAMRLAKYNITAKVNEDKTSFIGFPIPSAAITLVSYIVFIFDKNILPQGLDENLIFYLVPIVSWAMIGKMRFENAPRPNLQDLKKRWFFTLMFVLAVVLASVTAGKAIFFVMITYLGWGIIRWFINLFSKDRLIEEIVDDEDID